ncbi:hypothetical protein EVAR_50344_1 [Eumeta japonica]|uniref:Uncharacterized protein n=1 Tax=Eumeta variegata TaxID=151549 RepID=A0A4C1XRJ1_EUMVA|nr:hypothetical protein EVAR_50344_1 [Eumeta japonica]
MPQDAEVNIPPSFVCRPYGKLLLHKSLMYTQSISQSMAPLVAELWRRLNYNYEYASKAGRAAIIVSSAYANETAGSASSFNLRTGLLDRFNSRDEKFCTKPTKSGASSGNYDSMAML